MVKEAKIKQLVYGKLADTLTVYLNGHGFTYAKSKQRFVRPHGNVHQVIYLSYPTAPIIYDDRTDKLFLSFTLTTGIEIPDFDKWYLEKTGNSFRFFCPKDTLNSELEISMEEFKKEDFYTPTASQEFKRNVTRSLTDNEERKKNFIPFNELTDHGLQKLISSIETLSDIEKVFDGCGDQLSPEYISLLNFGGFPEKADAFFDRAYSIRIQDIREMQGKEDVQAKNGIGRLDTFIASAGKLAQRSYTNPFARSVRVMDGQDEKFDFTANVMFSECLRLDVSQYDIKSLHINSTGDILLFADNNKIFKFSGQGELLLYKEIAPPTGFDRFWVVRTGLIGGTDEFFVNNYIIGKDKEPTELPLPRASKKGKKLQDPHIIDLAYSQKTDRYLVLYQNSFITYSKEGKQEKTIPVAQGYYNRIITEKEWIVCQQKDTANLLLDFEGQIIQTCEFLKGNFRYEFSGSFDKMVCFFYAAKSQLHDLEKRDKETLWAHPTFIKDYKETLYSDVNHNFGMTIAKFSPDGKYLVGGADHGKYVAWTLPGSERVELIPAPEALGLLNPKPEIVRLQNQQFLKNRGNGISNIIFLENGDFFLTELGSGKISLFWDRNFNNLAYYTTKGKIDWHSQQFLTQSTKEEIVVYKSQGR